MEKYAPNKMELASRDVVSRAEQTEINEGRGFPDGTVALDITVVPRKRIHEALREIVNVGRDFAGVDITREPIHIKPGNHYVMGGVKTDVDGQTSIPGLYAAGECACVSVHGGNRLGANSLLDTLVFGRALGRARGAGAPGPWPIPCAAALRSSRTRTARSASSSVASGTGRRVSEIKAELGATMDKYVAVFRDEDGLTTAPRDRAPPQGGGADGGHRRQGHGLQPGRASARSSCGYMLDNAEAIVIVGAIERKESRGAQFRTDYPERNDDEWLKHINLTAQRRTEPEISYSEVTMTQWQPQERTY